MLNNTNFQTNSGAHSIFCHGDQRFLELDVKLPGSYIKKSFQCLMCNKVLISKNGAKKHNCKITDIHDDPDIEKKRALAIGHLINHFAIKMYHFVL